MATSSSRLMPTPRSRRLSTRRSLSTDSRISSLAVSPSPGGRGGQGKAGGAGRGQGRVWVWLVLAGRHRARRTRVGEQAPPHCARRQAGRRRRQRLCSLTQHRLIGQRQEADLVQRIRGCRRQGGGGRRAQGVSQASAGHEPQARPRFSLPTQLEAAASQPVSQHGMHTTDAYSALPQPRTVGDELAQEDVFVGVERVDDDVHHAAHLRLAGFCRQAGAGRGGEEGVRQAIKNAGGTLRRTATCASGQHASTPRHLKHVRPALQRTWNGRASAPARN